MESSDATCMCSLFEDKAFFFFSQARLTCTFLPSSLAVIIISISTSIITISSPVVEKSPESEGKCRYLNGKDSVGRLIKRRDGEMVFFLS